jgi:RNA polymerase sigma-70 factor (ECF subfamily)
MTDSEFRDSFHCHKDVLYRFAYRMTGSATAAEDVVQDSFMALWKRPGGYDPERGAMRGYLLGIARKVILKRWRQDHQHSTDDGHDGIQFSEPLDLVRMERAEAIAAAVQQLPPLQREALVLAEYEDFSLEEIARVTRADLAAVKSRLHRARQNLRKSLAPLLEDKRDFYGTPK